MPVADEVRDAQEVQTEMVGPCGGIRRLVPLENGRDGNHFMPGGLTPRQRRSFHPAAV